MKLTEQQLSFFDTFGYLAFPGLMADCMYLLDKGGNSYEVVQDWPRLRRGARSSITSASAGSRWVPLRRSCR